MAKQLENITMFYRGDPGQGSPETAFFSYDVGDGDLKKRHQVYEVVSPTWSNSPNTIWAAGVAQIKTNEGIA